MSVKPDDSQKLGELLEQGLKQWHEPGTQLDLTATLPALGRRAKAAWPAKSTLTTGQLTNQLLLDLLETLAEVDTAAAGLLRRRYIDDETGFAVANTLGISESAFYRLRREALARLAELARSREAEAWVGQVSRLEARLEPAAYHQLFGLAPLQERLLERLCEKSDRRLFCLAGLGGIGKTSLADALARAVIRRGCFDELAWVSARQQQFAPWGEIQETGQPALTAEALVQAFETQLSESPPPPRPPAENLAALKARLAGQSHLLILDNLETAADYQALLPTLRELGQAAWILITSRVAIHEQPDVHLTSLTELEQPVAAALLRDEADRRGLDELAQAPDGTLAQIYTVVGGNPLALKLVVGLVQVRSLTTVLADLREARGQRSEALYDYIYRQAWALLDEPARRVLLTMPLVADPGTTLAHLAGMTGLPYDELDRALERLVRLSLVNVGGDLQERRYSIHRLTETFLHKQVTKWS